MPSKPNERRRSKTRLDIIQTAHRLIVQQGQEALSIRALAEQIDYSPAALYRYFGSKDELIDAIRERCFQQLNSYIIRKVQSVSTAREQLFAGGLAYIEYAAGNPVDYHLMFQMEPTSITHVDHREVTMQALLQIVRFGIDNGEFVTSADYSAKTIAYHCWATVHGLAILQTTLLREETEDIQAMSRPILERVISSFSA